MDEDDFEDVQPEAPSTLREVQPIVAPSSDANAVNEDRSPVESRIACKSWPHS